MTTSNSKHFIHFVGGEKGGAGKTLFSRTIIQYGLDENLNVQPVEADFSNPDVAEVYQGLCEKVQFTEDAKRAREVDRIFEWALQKSLIVNLPAQSHEGVKNWIDKNELIALGEKNGVSFVHWFVCSGGYDSVQLFFKSLKEFDKRVLHVLVKNLGLRDDWSDVENDKDFKKITGKYKPYCTIEFPKLAYFERDVIDKERLRFDRARDCFEFDFGVVNRQRVHNFLRDAYAQIKQTKLFENEIKIPEKKELTTSKPPEEAQAADEVANNNGHGTEKQKATAVRTAVMLPLRNGSSKGIGFGKTNTAQLNDLSHLNGQPTPVEDVQEEQKNSLPQECDEQPPSDGKQAY